ncbi:unnamed protein product [Spirodela intermedia]|uniref:Uncharacterized protein n=1 Tax=Spirodela intermedia TaxID=51605 RepID=A0A7I8J6M5_SPIIN|nr:unnamed protein product [Spirodela intermedia]CAA6665709.1 unnamed protein product [Spirodela intermedia]
MTKGKWAFSIVVISLIFVFSLITYHNMGLVSSRYRIQSILPLLPAGDILNQAAPLFVESRFLETPPSPPADDVVPALAYLVSGSKGDLESLWRTLQALYHPRNQYIIHMDLKSPAAERMELAIRLKEEPVFAKMGNVHMITKANMVTYRGPTMVANTLHACAILLRRSKKWDWFINLSASDYPLVTQDDILHTFSTLPRNLNFVEHTSRLGWKEAVRARPLIIDPGLYMTNISDLFWVTPKRDLPTAFRLFTGSAWMALTREFVEFCLWGWDNLPRTLLMYHTNFLSTPESYFQTVICNVPEYARTTVNHDLHYILWDTPPNIPQMVASNAPFARKFNRSDPALAKIDSELLGRRNGSFVPGGWCTGVPLCSEVGNVTLLNPGPGARRLEKLMAKVVRSRFFRRYQCK